MIEGIMLGVFLTIILEAALVVVYNFLCYKELTRVNEVLGEDVEYCCAQRIRDYHWPMPQEMLDNTRKEWQNIRMRVKPRFLGKKARKLLKDVREAVRVLENMKNNT